MATKAPCRKCILLTRELASATFEVAAIQKDILARDRKTTSPDHAAKLLEVRRVAQEAMNALAAHQQSHESVAQFGGGR